MHERDKKAERRLSAIAVSRGIGIGRVVFLHGEKRRFFRIDLDELRVEAELQRFRSAVADSVLQLRNLAANDNADPNHPVSGIFGVHLLILEESSLIEKIELAIRTNRVNAEWALKLVSDQYIENQEAAADLRFREKYLDIEDVVDRLLKTLIGKASNASLPYSGAVVVSRELRPSAIMELTKSGPVALITEHGGWTSHASILAREFQLPMASGIQNLEQTFLSGDQVIVDGLNGEVIVNPTNESIAHFRSMMAQARSSKVLPDESLNALATNDGTPIVIRANVDIPEAYKTANKFGALGIGLYRSEALLRDSGRFPSEDEQVSAYRLIGNISGKHGVKIRTFDIERDHAGDPSSSERNPALGLRSIRLSLSDTSHFRPQIRAILRASFDERIDIVLPMISGVGDVLRSKAMIAEERVKLEIEGIPIGDPKIGAMIEVPSSVLTVEEIVENVDFVCLGTNDLVQYLLAVDRDNDSVADWYQSLHPAVIRAISRVLFVAAEAGIPASVCGEMAGSAFYVPLLIGLGARELSMNVNSIQQVRHLVSGISVGDTIEIIDLIRTCRLTVDIETVLREYYIRNWNHLFSPGLLNTRHR